MNGMFYSLQQTAERLNKTEEEVNAIVKEGRLRVFFDGPNELFKIDEVEALLADTKMKMEVDHKEEPVDEEPVAIEDDMAGVLSEDDTMSLFESSDEDVSEGEDMSAIDAELDDVIGLADEPDSGGVEEVAAEESDDIGFADEADDAIGLVDDNVDSGFADFVEDGADTSAETTELSDVSDSGEAESGGEDDFIMLDDDVSQEPEFEPEPLELAEEEPVADDLMLEDEMPQEQAEEPAADESFAMDASDDGSDDDLFQEDDEFADLSETLGLSDSSEETAASLTSADDTTLDGGGVNVLGESDGGYQLASDTMGDTVSDSAFGEESLEDIDDDVNLDSFGSGSGLLDLSLQADDTSLGGILDEIYTSDDNGDAGGSAGAGSAAMDVTAVADDMFGEADLGGGGAPEGLAAAAMMSFEPAPDKASNMLGMVLILPFIVVVYTTIVVISGFAGFKPMVLSKLEGMIGYVFIGFIGLSVLLGAVACLSGGQAGAKPKKEKKPKAKKEKKKKEKKPKKKKEKKAKKK